MSGAFLARLVAVLAIVAFVQAPAALASSGSITNVHNVSGSQYQATYTTSFDRCTSSGYCGWFPEAWQVPATEPCASEGSHPVYVGSTQSASGTLSESDTFYAAFTVPTRLCLYAYQSSTWTFIAETTFTPSSSGSGTPPPSGSGDGAATGTITEAHSVADGKASATFTSTVTACPSSGTCLWYPSAYQVPAAQPCPDTSATLTRIVYVGASHTGTGTVTATETFSPTRDEPHLRLCLYVALGSATKQLVAQAPFSPTATGSISGYIAHVHGLASGKVEATFVLHISRCLADGTCSWSGRAYRLPASRRCIPDSGEWVWLGNYHSRSGDERKTVSFAPQFTGRIRLCLYVRQQHTERLLDQTTFTVPKPKPFSLSRAKVAVNDALARRFDSAFLLRGSYSRSCRRISSKRVTCSVFWTYARDTYQGTVTVWVDALPWTHIHYRLSILRRHPLR